MLKTILVAVALSVIFTLTACFGGSSSSDATACAESASLSQSLNVSVVGDGYFVLAGGLGLTYRRSGILSIDDNGFIVVGENAQRLQGSPALSSGGFATGTLTEMTVTDANIGSSQLEINELGLLYALVDDKPLAFGQLVLTIFYNPEELFEIGPDGEEFAETFGAGYPTTAAADTEGYGPICISRHTPPESEPSPTPGEQLLSGNLTLSLWGLGYFIVDRNGQQGLMRTGTFGIDGDGRVATAEGWVLQGHSAINGVFQREVITDLIVTEHGVDLSTIDISKFSGVFFAAESEVVLGQLLLANYDAPFLLTETEPGLWLETAAAGQPSVGTVATRSFGYILMDRPASELDYTLDLAAASEGYLILEDAVGDTFYAPSVTVFSDVNRTLINDNGYFLQGGITIPSQVREVKVDASGEVIAFHFASVTPVHIGQLELALFPNQDGLLMVSEGIYVETVSSGVATRGVPLSDGFGEILGDTLFSSSY